MQPAELRSQRARAQRSKRTRPERDPCGAGACPHVKAAGPTRRACPGHNSSRCAGGARPVSYTHLRAHETSAHL
eukprot:6565176-Alexandrium_andersonii.AAC.1